MKNHMLGEHGIGDNFHCDHCDFQAGDRVVLKVHIEKDHIEKYETCGGNCSDRMYEETLLNVKIVKPCSVKSVHSLIKVNIAGVVTIYCVKRTEILAHFSGSQTCTISFVMI